MTTPPSSPRRQIYHGWLDEKKETLESSFSLKVVNKALIFDLFFPSGSCGVEGSTCGQFIEGLWEAEVGELFLARTLPDGQTRYLEINISPEGAWWSMEHQAVRQRKPNCRPLNNVNVCSIDESTVQMSIPLSSLPDWLLSPDRSNLSDESSGNVTFILATANGDKQHLSFFPLAGENPDFHQPEAFLEIQKLLSP